jgi:hypothetical protein
MNAVGSHTPARFNFVPRTTSPSPSDFDMFIEHATEGFAKRLTLNQLYYICEKEEISWLFLFA